MNSRAKAGFVYARSGWDLGDIGPGLESGNNSLTLM